MSKDNTARSVAKHANYWNKNVKVIVVDDMLKKFFHTEDEKQI
jgi:hypothetical protein